MRKSSYLSWFLEATGTILTMDHGHGHHDQLAQCWSNLSFGLQTKFWQPSLPLCMLCFQVGLCTRCFCRPTLCLLCPPLSSLVVLVDRLQHADVSIGHVSPLLCLRILAFWSLLLCSTGKPDRVGDLTPQGNPQPRKSESQWVNAPDSCFKVE